MVDYEPSLKNTTEAHAIAYASFLSQLSSSLHANGKKLGMDISDWGILNKYNLYAKLDLDVFTSMSTYNGANVTANINIVDDMVSNMNTNLLGIGIGTMCSNQGFAYNWTEGRLNTFLDFLIKSEIQKIDIWRADIDNPDETNTTEPWFLKAVEDWNQKNYYHSIGT